MEGQGLRTAYEASRIAAARADPQGAFVRDRLLPNVDGAIRRACMAGRRSVLYDLPLVTGHRPVAEVMAALQAELRRRGYQTERQEGRPRALLIRWSSMYGL